MEKEYKCSLLSEDSLIVDSGSSISVNFYVIDDGLASTGIILGVKEVKKLVKQLKKFLKEYDPND